METNILVELGLTEDEAKIYNVLLEGGFMPARTVAIRASLGRPLSYKILDDLIKKNVVEKKETGGKIALFAPVHPRELEKLLDKKKEEIENTKKTLDESLGQMISKYNLFIGKPNVQFFEGKEGALKVAMDSLSSTTDICSFIDTDVLLEVYPELNKEYVSKRLKNNVKKKIISTDSKIVREIAKTDDKNLTEQRIVKQKIHFATIVMIYDNKVSFITLDPKRNIGIIVEDPDIYKTNQAIFDYIWETAEKL
ncbi:MAG: helix-turn-helix domain-containing protein [Candidatus Paceibacterota bacterium]|jgi:sugar-specific transcriptional regulator TrmB